MARFIAYALSRLLSVEIPALYVLLLSVIFHGAVVRVAIGAMQQEYKWSPAILSIDTTV